MYGSRKIDVRNDLSLIQICIVPPEQAASYGAIIDEILANSDLASVSAKQVRKQLAEKVGYDMSDQKVR